jgi:general secretion pathway protein K
MKRERGLALVSVLWGVAILSLIAAAMLSASLTSAHVDRNSWNATRAASVADAAVNQAILALLDDRAPRQPRVDGVAIDLVFDGVPYRVWIQDESGKINVNFASRDLLAAVFGSAGMAADDASALAGRIVARRGADDATGPRITFRALDELLAVNGMTRELLARAEPALTVYGRGATVNQQVAPRAVLRVLPDMDDDAIARLLKARDEQRAAASAAANGTPLGSANAVFLVTAEVRAGSAHVVRVAAIQFTGDAAQPYLILGWR